MTEGPTVEMKRIVTVATDCFQDGPDHWSTRPIVFECDENTTIKTVVDYYRRVMRENFPSGIQISYAEGEKKP